MRTLDPTTRLPDRYRVVRHIANGGMASVWAAEDGLLGRLVAVKILAPGYAADADARRRFTREARAAARVSDHPHVVTIYDIGETEDDDPQAFIVMEHLAGGTVGQRLRSGDPIPVPTVLRWLEEAASALDAAHAADIVHRDVKPANLLLDERGRLAVADFGIASIAGETALTQAGQIVGTAAYISPEQANGKPATPASDRYALAVVAYELLCGRRPFAGETPVAQMQARLHAEPPTLDGACAAGSEALRHGLAVEPTDRPVSAAAFVEELRDALGDDAEPVTAPTRPVVAARPTPPAAPSPSPSRRLGFPLALAGALALGALIAVIAALASGGGDDTPTSASTAERTTQQPRKAQSAPRTTATPSAPASTPAAAGGTDPAALNDQGFALLPGDPDAAIPLLQRSVDGFREQGRTDEQAYAYALYNLGWALRLAGRPDEAVPYLEERLRYPDNTGDAERELALARGDQPGKGKAKGKAKKGD